MKSQVISVAVVVSLLVGCSSTPSISADHPSIGTPGNESIYPPAEIFGYYNDLGKAGYNAIKAALLERCVPDKKSGALAALEMGIAEFYKEGRAEEIIEFLDAHKDDIIDNVDLTDKSNEQIDKEMKRLNWHYSHTLRFYQFSLVDELELERMLLQDITNKTMEIYFDIRKALRAVWHTSRYDLIELLDKVEKAWENIEWVEEKILPSGSVQKRDWMKTLRHDLSQALELLKYGYYSDVEKYSTIPKKQTNW